MGGAPPLPDTLSRIPPSPPCQNDMKRGVNTIGEILEKFFGKLGPPIPRGRCIYNHMKIIITESQNNRITTRVWVRRRYDLIRKEFKEAIANTDPCQFDYFVPYEMRVVNYIMDSIHPKFYLLDYFEYNEAAYVINVMFRTELLKIYDKGRKNCN
jgi:hypothetical protein